MTRQGFDFGLLYWGRTGGGLELFHQTVAVSTQLNLKPLLFERPKTLGNRGKWKDVGTLNAFRWLKARKTVVEQAKNTGIRSIIFVMASPWDLLLGKRLEKQGIEVIRIIHDATPHPGDFFPPKFWIRWLIRDSSRIVTLSQYVADRLFLCYVIGSKPIHASTFPTPVVNRTFTSTKNESNKILLIGRGKRYQGQKLLEEAWELIRIPNAELVIAGLGFKQSDKHSGVTFKNEWMTHQELENEIASSKLVIFPYLEASQSGTIPICIALGIPVVVTPVGGLVEQVKNGMNGIIATEVTAKALAEAIERAWNLEWRANASSLQFSQKRFLQDCLQLDNL